MADVPSSLFRNRLLNKISATAVQRIRPYLETVTLKLDETVHEVGQPIQFVYFPEQCVLSALTIMRSGSAIEVDTVGNEGACGLSVLLETPDSIHRVVTQVPGTGTRIRADVLRRETLSEPFLRKRLFQYHTYFFAQISWSVACNGLHPLQQRCCRWLLMTRDRLESDEIPLTHEYLSYMLGVRRAGVTEVLQKLQKQGLISCRRGNITVRDRQGLEAESCECYQNVKQVYERLLK